MRAWMLLTAAGTLLAMAAPGQSAMAQQAGGGAAAPRVIQGEGASLGEGRVTAWVAVDAVGQPVSVGLTVTDAALRGLPHATTEINLALPQEARQAGFDHVGLDWAPHGHEPPGVYDRPHFDVHFYLIPRTERERIGPEDPAFERRLAAAPASGLMPAGYVQTPGGVPRMGAHWVPADAPELQGGRFERTMILGTYDGRVAFLEPMVTLEFLGTRPDLTLPMRAPERAAAPLAWPASWSIRHDAGQGVTRISLDGLRPLAER